MRKHVLFILKLLAGLGLLAALLLVNDNWRTVVDLAGDVQVGKIPLLVLVSVALVLVSTLKWSLFLRASGVGLPQTRLFRLYIIGYFFNNFVPSSFGGDVVRSYMLGRQIQSQARAASSVFFERLSGFIAMVSLAIAAYLVNQSLQDSVPVTVGIAFMAAATIAGVAILWNWGFIDSFFGLTRHEGKVVRYIAKIAELKDDMRRYVKNIPLVFWSMMFSYLFYLLACVNVYVAALVLDIQLSFLQLLVVVPIIMLLASVPLTPNSIGIWEWSYSIFMVAAGATVEQGIAIALVTRARDIAVSVVGGLLFLAERGRPTGERDKLRVNRPGLWEGGSTTKAGDTTRTNNTHSSEAHVL